MIQLNSRNDATSSKSSFLNHLPVEVIVNDASHFLLGQQLQLFLGSSVKRDTAKKSYFQSNFVLFTLGENVSIVLRPKEKELF